jgi:DNA-binding transcriptional regulator GbsR (MarR family)
MFWIKNSRNMREYSWINTFFQKNIYRPIQPSKQTAKKVEEKKQPSGMS